MEKLKKKFHFCANSKYWYLEEYLVSDKVLGITEYLLLEIASFLGFIIEFVGVWGILSDPQNNTIVCIWVVYTLRVSCKFTILGQWRACQCTCMYMTFVWSSPVNSSQSGHQHRSLLKKTRNSSRTRTVDITSYQELCMIPNSLEDNINIWHLRKSETIFLTFPLPCSDMMDFSDLLIF